jgi:hypothetical protein
LWTFDIGDIDTSGNVGKPWSFDRISGSLPVAGSIPGLASVGVSRAVGTVDMAGVCSREMPTGDGFDGGPGESAAVRNRPGSVGSPETDRAVRKKTQRALCGFFAVRPEVVIVGRTL